MARKFILENLMKLAQGIGANPQKFMGTRTNITFLGKGPTKNPLFQGPLRGIETASETQLGPRETIISTVEDAMGYASAGKLNDIQLKALTINLKGLNKIYNPPVLPMASVTDMAPGIRGLSRDLPPPGSRGGPDDIAAPFRSAEDSIRAMRAMVDVPQKTASARATMIKLLDMQAGHGGLTLREIMSKQDLKWLMEGGGGAEGHPIAMFAKYFGPLSTRQIPSTGTPEVIEEFAKQVIRRKDRLGRGINDPFFNPEDITFAHGGLARILEV